MAAAAKPRQKAAKGHKLPEHLPLNLEITDTIKKTWIIGKEIGSGGFGTVYLGANSKNPKDFDYVIKVEYHANGPLFVEMHCYQKIGKPELLENWSKKRKLNYLGLSPCYGAGSFEYNNSKYRFMVLERYGKDLQKLLEENGNSFPVKTVYLVALSVIDTLEYIHSSGYLHGDIKAANLLLGRKKETENQVYLVDLGLACKYIVQGTHKKNVPNPKMAHNGTLAVTSRDAHNGSFARRSDLEILGYNMLQWLTGHLPWEKCKTPVEVQKEKIKFMENKEKFLIELFPEGNPPGGMLEFLKYVNDLEFEEEPDYDYCRNLLKDNLKKMGCSNDKNLVFEKVSKHTTSSQVKASDKENFNNKSKETRAKRKDKAEIYVDPALIPTPAMLEIMNKKSTVEKVPKTRKKS